MCFGCSGDVLHSWYQCIRNEAYHQTKLFVAIFGVPCWSLGKTDSCCDSHQSAPDVSLALVQV